MKKALVLSGGGYKGIFQAAVLSKIPWDFGAVFGTSVGSLNGLLVAQGDPDRMTKFWQDVTSGMRFHKASKLNYLRLLFGKRGIYTNVLENELEKEINTIRTEYFFTVTDATNDRLFYIGAKNLGPAFSVSFYDHNFFWEDTLTMSKGELAKLINASTVIPGIFDPVDFELNLPESGDEDMCSLVDGGVRNVTPLAAAIAWGAEEITIIDCSPAKTPVARNLNRIDRVIMRAIDLMVAEINRNDVQTFADYNKLASESDIINKATGKQIRYIPMKMYRPEFLLMEDSINPTVRELQSAYHKGLIAEPTLV